MCKEQCPSRFQVPKRAGHLLHRPVGLDLYVGPSAIPWDSSCHWILDENLWDFLINLTISPTVTEYISVGCKLGFPHQCPSVAGKIIAVYCHVHDNVTCGPIANRLEISISHNTQVSSMGYLYLFFTDGKLQYTVLNEDWILPISRFISFSIGTTRAKATLSRVVGIKATTSHWRKSITFMRSAQWT